MVSLDVSKKWVSLMRRGSGSDRGVRSETKAFNTIAFIEKEAVVFSLRRDVLQRYREVGRVRAARFI